MNKFIIPILLISLSLNIYLLLPKSNTFKVTDVIDGDTFKISVGRQVQRVRLMSVNAPEIDKCLGPEAKQKLEQLVKNKNVTLKDQFSDPYGRVMANVYVGQTHINLEMIKSGLVRMDYYDNPYREQLKQEYAKAPKPDQCISKKSPDNCQIKANTDNEKPYKQYFLPNCKGYNNVTINLSLGDQWFCTEKDALAAGFVKSTSCM